MASTDINAKTFPGVYTSITDNSFLPPVTSRFRAGLIGVTRKGPFDTPTAVRTKQEFARVFGQPIDGAFYLANAVAMICGVGSDGTKVVRIGNKYTAVSDVELAGSAGAVSGLSLTSRGQVFSPATAPYGQGRSVYVKISETGKNSTLGTVTSASTGSISLNTTLQDTYTSADVAYSFYQDAANKAEGVLYAYTYGSIAANTSDQAVTAAGYVTGNKNDYSFTISGNYSSLAVNDLIKIKESGKATTHEGKIQRIDPDGTVYLYTSDIPEVGYQALPLADSYTSASAVYRATGKLPFLFLTSASEGDWANGDDSSTGLYIKVRPGSAAGTKKLEIYENGALQETIDNIALTGYSAAIGTAASPISQYINWVAQSSANSSGLHAANTASGWNTLNRMALTNAGGAVGVYTSGTIAADGGGSFHNGQNGSNPQNLDYVGSYDPALDISTGIKAFEENQEIEVDILCCPGVTDATSTFAVHEELTRVARQINALAIVDVPDGLNLRQAVDWQNGDGVYSGRTRPRGGGTGANCAIYWNWFDIEDPYTAETKTVPPSLGALRCLAFTFDRERPWYAAAGDTRGLIPEAITVAYPRVSAEAKEQAYGAGQSVNPILLDRGQIKIYGERTQQIEESKLSVVHSVILVNYVVKNLANLGRRFVFEPNDAELLMRIRLAFSQFLDQVKNERGIEAFLLTIDDTNNTADTRNRREVIVDLALIPIDTAERIFINATVRQSGAVLNNVTSA
jgi:hypothetical protein